MGKKKVEEMNLDEQGVILWIPENAVEVTLKCKILMDGKLVRVERTLDNREIVEAHQEWEDNCVTYTLTEKGLKYLKECRKEKENE